MHVHDTDKLVARAHEHAAVDGRIRQGTYGNIDADGFHGCQIACLANPATPALRRTPESKTLADMLTRGENQVRKIENEFGIIHPLSRIGEVAFERSFDHNREGARLFVPQFAEAFNEGAWIDVEMCHEFHRAHEGLVCSPMYAEAVLDWLAGIERHRVPVIDRARSLLRV